VVLWQYKRKQELLLLLHPSILQLYDRHKKLNSNLRRKEEITRRFTTTPNFFIALFVNFIIIRQKFEKFPFPPNESATVERKRTKVEEQKGWSPNPKTIARGARV
jgi:hypothetical protein